MLEDHDFPRRTFIRGLGATATIAALGARSSAATDGSTNQSATEQDEGDAAARGRNRPTLLRTCSFNIRYDNPEDEHSWEERLNRVVETVTDAKPGLLGVQEAQPNQYDDLRGALDDYTWYGVGREDGDREGEMVPIAWRPDRFELLEKGAFWLSETPDEPSVGWDAELPRVTTWASLRHRETKRRLWFCNTHFSHVGKTGRVESAKLLRERASERAADGEDPVIMGDFNSKLSRQPYDIMTGPADNAESGLFAP